MKLAKDNRGSTGLEFAIVAPIWAAFAIGIVQTGMLVWVDNMMHDVVDATARCMAVNVNKVNPPATICHDLATMQSYAMSISSANTTAFWQATDFHLNDSNAGTCPGGSQVSIVYSYKFLFLSPFTISAKSCYPNWS